MPRKSDTDGQDQSTEETETAATPVEQGDHIVTLKLRQRAYWRDGLHEAGELFDYPKADADHLLTTTELFDVA